MTFDEHSGTHALAKLSRDLFGADIGVAIGQLPTTDPLETTAECGTENRKPADAARVAVSLATPSSTVSAWAVYGGHPEIRQPRCAKHALDCLRMMLLDSGPS